MVSTPIGRIKNDNAYLICMGKTDVANWRLIGAEFISVVFYLMHEKILMIALKSSF